MLNSIYYFSVQYKNTNPEKDLKGSNKPGNILYYLFTSCTHPSLIDLNKTKKTWTNICITSWIKTFCSQHLSAVSTKIKTLRLSERERPKGWGQLPLS